MLMNRCIHDMVVGTCGICDAERRSAAPRCRWCNRELRDPVSRELGTGPQCFSKEKTLPDEIRRRIAASESGAVSYGPLPANSANSWHEAFNRMEGVRAQVRTTDSGEMRIYLIAADDPRRVRRHPS